MTAHPKPIHIFRPGTHTAMQGQSLSFSETDLTASAAAYDPAKHEAPMVVGHPVSNGPAYGWVSGLTATSEGLFATPRQVVASFAESVNEGRFKKVSASFYSPDSKHNPVPGVYYLRHVGFLGAQPPAVKGLQDVEFCGAEEDFVTVEFGEAEDDPLENVFYRALKRVVPKLFTPAFAEENPMPTPQPQPDPQQQQAAAAPPVAPSTAPGVDAVSFAEMQQQIASFQEQRRRDQATLLVNDALAKGKLTPAHATGLVDFMASLSDEGVLSFGEGAEGGKAASPISQTVFMQQFLASLPRQVDFSEASRDEHNSVDGLTPEQAAQEALCYQEKLRQSGIVISVTDAIAAVKQGRHKEPHHG